jgi:two-component system, cell cycle response regulator DivK
MTRILVVEDDEFNRDMLSRRLIKQGFDIVIAVDGIEGVDLAHSEQPDLILMDISLPKLDGLEATRQLKSSSDTQAIPIIVLTAHAFEGDREASTQAGCDDFDIKPIDMPRLLSKIQALLE